MERLQKRIATSGYCSRRKAEELIQKGLVEVNGEVITKLGTTVKPGDIITVEGNILDNSKAYEYYLLNKPKGVVTTTNDEKGRNTVIDLIETNTRIYPVGRLDYDTTGALILTNDGNLANLLMRPDSQVDKTYIAKVKGITPLHGKNVTATDLRGGASMLICGLIADGITQIDNIKYMFPYLRKSQRLCPQMQCQNSTQTNLS